MILFGDEFKRLVRLLPSQANHARVMVKEPNRIARGVADVTYMNGEVVITLSEIDSAAEATYRGGAVTPVEQTASGDSER